MTVYTITMLAKDSTLHLCDGVQGVCSTEEKAEAFLRGLWNLNNETALDYERADDWTEIFYTDKATYTIEQMELDYMIDE